MTREAYRKHKELIDIWSTGIDIEVETSDDGWSTIDNDHKFHESNTYRVREQRYMYLSDGDIKITKLTYSNPLDAYNFLVPLWPNIVMIGSIDKVEEVILELGDIQDDYEENYNDVL